MSKKVYIVTDVELGWDNVVAVYTNKKAAKQHVKARGDSAIVHENILEETFEDDIEEE